MERTPRNARQGKRPPRDAASSATLGIIFASMVIAGTFYAAQAMVSAPAERDSRGVTFNTQAATAIDLMIHESGATTTGDPWAKDADKMTRFGLALDGRPNFLDYEKIKALRNGSATLAGTNKAPDYPEVHAALGLRGADFHLRSYPVLPGMDDPRWVKQPTGRAAYFAHYTGGNAPVTMTTATWGSTTTLNVTVTLKNEALLHAVFTAQISVGDQDSGDLVATETRHTRLLAPGESQTLYVDFYRLSSWDDDIDAVHIEVTDPYGNIAMAPDGTVVGDRWLSVAPPEGGSAGYNILVSANKPYYVSGDTVKFRVDHYDGNGDHVNNAKARFVLIGPNNKEWVNTSPVDLPKPKNQAWEYACTNCTTVGNYTVLAWDSGGTPARPQRDVVHVSAAKMFTEKSTLDGRAAKEIQLVGQLIEQFDQTRYDPSSNTQGDVFGDDSNGPSELPAVLSRYQWLIVGSEVSQTALTPAAMKYAIADWVQAGGNLIVLGTKDSQSRWLEPIYKAAQTNANGGISAPDSTHPILVSPNRLQYDRYLDRGRAWDVAMDQPFTHVLTRGTQGTSYLDTLAVGNPGALGNGTVSLTSYMPGALTEPQDDAEALRLLQNLLSQSYTMLFLDYGPPIPVGVPVGSATRLVAVPHPNVPGAVVEVLLVLYVFP